MKFETTGQIAIKIIPEVDLGQMTNLTKFGDDPGVDLDSRSISGSEV